MRIAVDVAHYWINVVDAAALVTVIDISENFLTPFDVCAEAPPVQLFAY